MDKLSPEQKQIIVDRIRALDPKGEIVTVEPNATYSGGNIAYDKNSGIQFGEKNYRLTDEEYVRAY